MASRADREGPARARLSRTSSAMKSRKLNGGRTRLAVELLAQLRFWWAGGRTGRCSRMADAHHDAAAHDERAGWRSRTPQREQRPRHDVAGPGRPVAVDLQRRAIKRSTSEGAAARVSARDELPRRARRACRRGRRGRAGVQFGTEINTGRRARIRNGPAGGPVPTPTTGPSHAFHVHALAVIAVLEVGQQCVSVCDRVDGRDCGGRRSEPPHGRWSAASSRSTGKPFVDGPARLPSPGLRALRHLICRSSAFTKVLTRPPEAPDGSCVIARAPRVAVSVAVRNRSGILRSTSAVYSKRAPRPVHRDRDVLVRIRDRPSSSSRAAREPLHRFGDRFRNRRSGWRRVRRREA